MSQTCHEETFASASPHSTPRSCLGLRTREICNFSQCRCCSCGGKGRPKLTGYAYLSLDDQRRSHEFYFRTRLTLPKVPKAGLPENAARVCCGFDKMELRVEQSPYKGAALAGTIDLGDLTVNRLGFGAMRLCGDSAWGRPRDRGHANRVLHRAVELGVNFIDTADSYGPETNESLISQALYPYPPGLVIATKGGLVRPNRRSWVQDGRPDHLRRAVEGSLQRLRLERIDLYQFHAPDPNVPFIESVGALADLQRLGKIRHIGISNVTVAQLEVARSITPIVSVQNMYNLRNRTSEDVLAACERLGIAFLPWYPLGGKRGLRALKIKQVALRRGLTHAALSLAWLLAKSPVMLPIPGTRSIDHLKDNVLAAALKLAPEDFDDLG
jgi:pyridoxine 4-dehydrogenase